MILTQSGQSTQETDPKPLRKLSHSKCLAQSHHFYRNHSCFTQGQNHSVSTRATARAQLLGGGRSYLYEIVRSISFEKRSADMVSVVAISPCCTLKCSTSILLNFKLGSRGFLISTLEELITPPSQRMRPLLSHPCVFSMNVQVRSFRNSELGSGGVNCATAIRGIPKASGGDPVKYRQPARKLPAVGILRIVGGLRGF